ncbi:phage major capsid protein [Alcaligenaceae bacterium C4P045]|nr:phage major capsid protein [Alcaligenaceae bacterium C4P045]
MPISAADLAEAGKISLDEYLRNDPVDQIGTQHPLLQKLMAGKKLFGGARQNIVENIRKGYGSNFQFGYGETPVLFNKRHTTEPATFPWRRATDALYIDHDRLFSNGIDVREGDRGAYKLEQNEKVQLVNLLTEQNEVLKLGFMEGLDLALHRDGTSGADAVTGLDGIISTTPTVGTVGGLDASTATYWRNFANVAISTATKGNVSGAMEAAWRACIRNGGVPDFILAGTDFIDAYKAEIVFTQNAEAGKAKTVDLGVGTGTKTGLYFKGVEIIWDPTFATLDALETPDVPWEKRCYFLNTKHLKYRDNDMNIVKPVRPHDVLALYMMVILRMALTTNRRNAHAVLAIA